MSTRNNYINTKALRRWAILCNWLLLTLMGATNAQAVVSSDNPSAKKVTLTEKRLSLKKVMQEVEKQTELHFVYSPSLLETGRILELKTTDWVLGSLLNQISADLNVRYKVDKEKILLMRSAQRTVRGTVVDAATKEPLQGVSVTVQGTNVSTLTGENGSFEITAAAGDVLTFGFIGYTQKDLPAPTSAGNFTVELVESTSNLDEVVVTGYAVQRRKDLTSAVSVVNVSEMNRQPSGQINNQLQGQASGVTVIGSGQPGREPQVRIRGINTFGNNTPLYVVDGIPIQNIVDLNPNDIEQMQVLKDAGSASIYGARAANGVIIITTKKGKQDGEVRVNYDMFYGSQRPISGNIWDIASPIDNARLTFMAQRNSGLTAGSDLYGTGDQPRLPDYIAPQGAMEGDPRVNPALYNVNPNFFDRNAGDFYRINRANHAGTDWADEIFNNAPIMSHNIAVSHGNEKGAFLFSANYFDQQGVLKNTFMNRYTVRANSNYKIGDRIRVGENITYSLRRSPQSGEGSLSGGLGNDGIGELDEGSPIGHSFRQAPIIPVYDIMGNYAGTAGGGLGNARNPVAMADRMRNNRSQNNRIIGNVFAEADLWKNITARTVFGGEIVSGHAQRFVFPQYENLENEVANAYTENAINAWNWTWTNTINYKQNFNNVHDISVVLGTESFQENFRFMEATTQGYVSFDRDFVDLSTGFGAQTARSARDASTLFSYIGRIDYNFKQKYLLGVTLRRDASSKFFRYQAGWFPAVSAGWRVSDEEFMVNTKNWLNDFKIRGGYGIMGNQLNLSSRNSFDTFVGVRRSSYYDITGSGNSTTLGIQPFRIGNPEARWEKNINTNIGFDATLFSSLELNVDYYSKTVDDLLYNPELPGTAGRALQPFTNVARMRNSGLDMAITGNFKLGSDLKLTTTGTLTTYKNEIQSISQNSDYFDVIGTQYRFNGNYVVRNSVGNPMGSFYGYQVDGFWNSQDEVNAANARAREVSGNPEALYQTDIGVGRFRYADTNGDGIVDADDRTVLGNPNPTMSYGLNLGLTYKNWDFSAFLYGVAGNDIWNNVRWYTDFYSSFNGSANSNTAVYNSWTPENMNAKAPIQELNSYVSTKDVPNSYFVEPGGYLRLRNVAIGYTLPEAWLSRARLKTVRVYVQGANLFTATKYTGPDPEISGSAVAFGIDQGTYITPRQVLFGLNVGF